MQETTRSPYAMQASMMNLSMTGRLAGQYATSSHVATTSSPMMDQHLHQSHYQTMTVESYENYFDPRFPRVLSVFLWFVGLFGNILSIWVFSRLFKKNSTFVYLLFLCLVDLFVLVFGLGDIILFSYFGFVAREQSIFVCRAHTFLTYVSTHLSSFILASVSIDRAIATNLITYAKVFCKRRMAYKVVLLNLCLAALSNSHYLLFLGYEDKVYDDSLDWNTTNSSAANRTFEYKISCSARIDSYYDNFLNSFYNWLDLTFYAILPFLIMAVCSFFIIRVIFSSNKRMKHSLSYKTSAALINAALINRVPEDAKRRFSRDGDPLTENDGTNLRNKSPSPLPSPSSSARNSLTYIKRLISKNDKKSSTGASGNSRMNKTLHLTYTLISINTLFFCLVSPLVIMVCLVNNTEEISKNKLLFNIVYLLAYSNHSLNFVFYGMSSPPFRQTIQSLFVKRKENGSPHMHTVASFSHKRAGTSSTHSTTTTMTLTDKNGLKRNSKNIITLESVPE